MKKIYIKFSSVTHAMRAKELIEQNGEKAILKKNTNPNKGEGCSYNITVCGNADRYQNLLRINQIKYIGIGYV